MEWKYSTVYESSYIRDEELKDGVKKILVTYETKSGRRYVKQAECYHGRVMKKVGGRVVAWMPLPEPAKGEPAREEILPPDIDEHHKRWYG